MASASLTTRLKKVRLWSQKHFPKTAKPTNPTLLTLPPEIRRLIYYYVLLAPSTYKPYPAYTPTTVQLSWTWPWASYIPPRLQLYTPEHWGQSSMSMLFLICHQIRSEAEEFFYRSGDFVFAWPRRECACCVPVFMSKRSEKAREMGGVFLRLLVNTHMTYLRYREEELFFRAILRELKALRRVVICVRFLGGEVEEEGQAWVVAVIVRLAAIFRGVSRVELLHDECEAEGGILDQGKKMLDDARGCIERGEWEELEEVDDELCCCEEQRKAWVTKHIR